MDNASISPGIILGIFLIILGIVLVLRNLVGSSKKPSTNKGPAKQMINRGQSFGYLFHDARWISTTIIHSLLLIFLPTTFIAIGYELRIIRNLSYDANSMLPDWKEPMEMFVNGVKFTLLIVGLLIPAVLLLILSLFPVIGSVISLLRVIFSATSLEVATQVAKEYALVFSFVFYLGIVYLFLIIFALPACMILYARSGKIQFKTVYRLITNNLSSFFNLWVIVSLAIGICSILTLIPVIGIIVSIAGQFWVFTVIAHSTSQIYSLPKNIGEY